MLMLVTFLPQLHLTLDDLFYVSVNFGLCDRWYSLFYNHLMYTIL